MTSAHELSKQIRLLTAELQDVSFGEEDFLPDELEIANRTSRSFGAVGAKAVVPRVVRDWIQVTDKVLDFGAGKDAAHAVRLKAEGYNVTAHEFGKNQQAGLHDPNALQNGPYDVVYASNVLNVQVNPRMLLRTLLQIRRAMKPGGIFIANFPKQPRKMGDFTPRQMADTLAEVFGVEVKTVRPGGMPQAGRLVAEPVFFVRYKGYKGKPEMGATTMANTDTKKAVQAAMTAIESAKALTSATKDWASTLEDHILNVNPGPMGDTWDIVKMGGGEFKAERVNSVASLWVKEYDGILSVVGKTPEGRSFKRQMSVDNVKKIITLIDKMGVGVRGNTVNAKHMQPQVLKDDVYVVDTDDGTFFLPKGDVGSVRDNDEQAQRQAVAKALGLGEVEILEVDLEKNKWLARSSAPGYMDATDYSMFDTEVEAWSYLIDMDPSLFTWTVELTSDVDEEGAGGTAHIYMDSDAAAKAMVDAVQSVAGSKLERDGDFVYVGLTGNGEEVKDELESMGFSTEEG